MNVMGVACPPFPDDVFLGKQGAPMAAVADNRDNLQWRDIVDSEIDLRCLFEMD